MKTSLRFLFFGVFACGWASLWAKPKMNVLFIPVDDLNHWVGYTGRNPQAKTPNIDRLSKMGVSFSNAHCSAPACEPTRASLFSGLRPSTSGCYLNGHLWKKYVKEGICLNAHFKDSGYYVMGTGKTYHASGTSKAAIYENEWHEYPRLPKSSTGGASKFQGYFEPLPLKMKDEDLGDWHSVNYCIEQLGKKRDKPFFLACGLIKPHLPWAVPQKYYDMFPRDTIKLPPHLENDFSDIPKFAHGVGTSGDHPKFLKSGRWKDAIQSYLATVAFVDVCIGRLLDAIEKSPHKDNTVIVLWGDHGYDVGEKKFAKSALWEQTTRTPLIIHVPEKLGGSPQAKTCAKPVSLLDLYPTLLDLCGLPKNPKNEGRSIAPLVRNPKAKWPYPAVITHSPHWHGTNHAIRSEHFHYIHYGKGGEELYEVAKDPHQWHNLANDPTHATTKAKLKQWLPKKNAPHFRADKQ